MYVPVWTGSLRETVVLDGTAVKIWSTRTRFRRRTTQRLCMPSNMSFLMSLDCAWLVLVLGHHSLARASSLRLNV